MMRLSATLRKGAPTALTATSILLGLAATILALSAGALVQAGWLIILAMICDILDGRVARALGVCSPFGRELDSLSDVISFGVAPAAMIWAWGLQPLGFAGFLAAGTLTVGAALRLARFNVVTTGADHYFQGLPVPLMAGAVAGLVQLGHPATSLPVVIGLSTIPVVLSLLMVSTIRYRTFKEVSPVRMILTASLLLLFPGLLLLHWGGFGLLALVACGSYILMGPMWALGSLVRRRVEHRL